MQHHHSSEFCTFILFIDSQQQSVCEEQTEEEEEETQEETKRLWQVRKRWIICMSWMILSLTHALFLYLLFLSLSHIVTVRQKPLIPMFYLVVLYYFRKLMH